MPAEPAAGVSPSAGSAGAQPSGAALSGDDPGDVARSAEKADAAPRHVLVLATLGAPERRLLRDRRARRGIAPEPPPTPVTTTRATVIDAQPVTVAEAKRWMAGAGIDEARAALATVARAVRAYRLASGDAGAHMPALRNALVVRAGYGAGEQVADGRWTAARELATAAQQKRRRSVINPYERIAALIGGRSTALACEELALRARADLDHGQLREAALQLVAALDAALSELRGAHGLTPGRLERLADERASAASLAQSALDGRPLGDDAAATLERGLAALGAALREWERAADRG